MIGVSSKTAQRLARHDPQALLVADLGSRGRPILEGVPTLLIDHHRPDGVPPGATLITGYGREPTPTSGLLAYWAAGAVADVDDLLWIAAISLLSDLGDDAPFGGFRSSGRGVEYGYWGMLEYTRPKVLNVAH